MRAELAVSKVIMIGCDLHEESMLLKIAVDRQTPETWSVKNTAAGRAEMYRQPLPLRCEPPYPRDLPREPF